MRNMTVEEVQCKTILNRSKMGFSDYTLNAYRGCVFGCSYCYVPVMRARRGQIDETRWGGWVQVKVNAPDVLRRQMLRIEPNERISIGTATDSWQPLEKKYEISRRILQELAHYANPVHVLTRSPLLIRDIDVLTRIENVRVAVSLPSFDEDVRQVFEPDAPAFRGRVNLVRRLVDAGLPVSLFFCPVLYGVMDNAEAIQDYVLRASELGVRRVVWDTLNYTEMLWKPHLRLLQEYRRVKGRPLPPSLDRAALRQEMERWSQEYGLAG